MRTIVSFFVTLSVITPASVAAQEPHAHADGERLGRVVFPTTCRPAAQRLFETGLAYLHSFWYEKAAETFGAAVAADSACGMGYWGQAMSLLHPLWTPAEVTPEAGLQAARRAVERTAAGTRERDYADAILSFYLDYGTQPTRARLLTYERAMAGVQARHPEDHEAAIFHALALIAVGQATPGDTAFPYQRRADSILDPLYRLEPQHPGLAHYLIHANDVPELAPYGLEAARRYAAIAPDVPHALHMPSHIFTRLGMWDDDIASNLRSAEAGRAFEERQHLAALWDQRSHADDYLVYAYLQQGQDRKAKALVDELAAATAFYPVNSLTNDYALAAIPARYALERGAWADAAQLKVRASPAWRAAEALTHFARAIGAARSGDTALARSEVAALDGLEPVVAAAGGPYDWAGQVRIQRLAAAAWVARAAGDTAEAVRLATDAADLEDRSQKHPVTPGALLPARELLGDLLLDLGRPAAAAVAYAGTLRVSPHRARALFGAARAAALAGDLQTARARYTELVQLMARADGNRPEMTELRRVVTP